MRCSSKCSHQLFGRFIAFFLTLKLLPVPASTAFGLYDSPLQWLQALIAFTIFLALKTALWALLIGSHAILMRYGFCREIPSPLQGISYKQIAKKLVPIP